MNILKRILQGGALVGVFTAPFTLWFSTNTLVIAVASVWAITSSAYIVYKIKPEKTTRFDT
jgi:hypothetical protein